MFIPYGEKAFLTELFYSYLCPTGKIKGQLQYRKTMKIKINYTMIKLKTSINNNY
jgi:hypothetical protein